MSELRLAILDSDSGFVRVLVKRAGDLGWQYRRLEAPPRTEEFVAMRVNALVVDLGLLGAGAWDFLERVVRGAARARASSSAPAARASRSACAACGWAPTTGSRSPATPRRSSRGWRPSCAGASAPRRGSRAARSWPATSRSGPTSSRRSCRGQSVDLTRREFEVLQLLAQAEGKVLQREEIYQAVWGYAMAHGDRSVDVFIRKVRQKLEKASPDVELHPHAFRRRLPLRPERREEGVGLAALEPAADPVERDHGRGAPPRALAEPKASACPSGVARGAGSAATGGA